VNVHASIALAGLGFGKTRSKIIADPTAGAVTGAYTPESAYQTLRRICVPEVGLQLA